MYRLTLIALCMLLTLACGKKDEDLLPKEREKMVRYLESTHAPRLVAEEAVEAGTEQPFYTMLGSTVYRYIDGYYNPDRAARKVVEPTSKVTIVFSAYQFNYQNIKTDGSNLTMPYYSNDPLLKELFFSDKVGLTPGAWSFEPQVIDLKNDPLIAGLRHALVGCRQLDRVEAYMTSNMAYGDHYLNFVEKNQPIAYFFTIKAVE